MWRGGYVDRFIPGQPEVDTLRDITELELQTKTYGRAAPEPLLGHYFELPRRPDRQDPIVLDDSLPTVRSSVVINSSPGVYIYKLKVAL